MATAFRSGTMGLIQHLFDGGTFAGLSDSCLLERFVARRDEAAFAALVMRHGAMVLNTCRAVLKDSNAADDAFQATFLLLFRKAGSIRGRDALGCWLHRVAYRVALQAASEATRRRDVEKAAGVRRGEETTALDDQSAVLHEEIERLPERFRLPLVLCDLEGLTRDQAANRLSLTEGSVRGRLAKARELLRRRLTRRGINLALPLATSGAIPETLVGLTARVAGGGASVVAEALARAFLRGWAVTRWKVVAVGLLAIGASAAPLAFRGTIAGPPIGLGAANSRVAPAQEPGEAVVDDQKKTTIEGRILDLEGRPIAGVSIGVQSVALPPDGNLDAWIDQVKRFGKYVTNEPRLASMSGERPRPSKKTGADGRFLIEKMPVDGIVTLSIGDPRIETAELYVLTREMPTLRVKNPQFADGRFGIYYGRKFDHIASPARSIVGTVRDKDTGAPIPGVHITGMPNIPNSLVPTPGVEATSDAQGHYEIRGLPASQGFKLLTEAPIGQPYVHYGFVAPASDPKPGPLTYDLALKPGVLVKGRLTVKGTGEPIRGSVEYYAFQDNKSLNDYSNYRRDNLPTRVIMPDQSGRFTIAALPGRGLIGARAQEERFLHGIGKDNIQGFDKNLGAFNTVPFYCPVSDKHVVAEINPAPGTREITLDLQADPGRTVTGTVVGPDGRPIVNGVMIRTLDVFQSPKYMASAKFEVTGLPSGPYRLDFFHSGRKLAGSIALKGDETAPVVVKLQPCGAVIGRVVDEEGKPRTDVEIFSTIRESSDPEHGDLMEKPTVDAQGRFRIDGLVPGVKYDALGNSPKKASGPILKGVQVAPGEVKDLGDITLPTYREKEN